MSFCTSHDFVYGCSGSNVTLYQTLTLYLTSLLVSFCWSVTVIVADTKAPVTLPFYQTIYGHPYAIIGGVADTVHAPT